MTTDQLQKEFEKLFSKNADKIFFCPGRVNLIGEHIDYNGGQVMPCAISMGTTMLVSKNKDNVFRFRAIDFPEIADIELQKSYKKTGAEWYNYPLGVIHEFLQKGVALSGLDFLFSGNLPIGSGLSSSASIEVLTAFALNTIFNAGMNNVELALLGKRVENDFMELNSGIMDQFAVAMGKEKHAILLNCDTLDYEYLPFEIGDYILAIINTNKPRKLVESKYNERFAECMAAKEKFQQKLNINHLCEMSKADYKKYEDLVYGLLIGCRAYHVITENERVKKAKDALLSGDIKIFGELMYESHESLKYFYSVSGEELDTIVEFCKDYSDCIGARMTGAGFGGCAIALIKKNSFDDFKEKITTYYEEKIGYKPGVFSSVIAGGVGEIL
jgi:galactokinase